MVLEMYLPLLASREEESRFEQIYHQNKNLLYHCAYDILGDVQLSEDAVSEAFLALIKNMATPVQINGCEGFLVVLCQAHYRWLCWDNGEYVFWIRTNIEQDALMKAAESVQKVELD